MTRDLLPQEQAVLTAIASAAAMNGPCPSNDTLASLIGASSASTPARCVKRLERKGVITVARGNSCRVVTVISTGAKTAGQVKSDHWRVRQPIGRRLRPRPDGREGHGPANSAPTFVSSDRTPCFYCGTRGDLGCEHRSIGG